MGVLFIDADGREYGTEDLYSALKAVGADDCNVLFIHSDIVMGKIPTGIKRGELLSEICGVLDSLSIKHLIVPTFTYSFCNSEDYNVQTSRTSMGVLNEFIRKKPGRYRTLDPLLSLSVPMDLKESFSNIGEHSLGENSGLDILHKTGNVRFLFLGARMGYCFTYLHYIEKMLDVPYRFDMPFSGKITDENGKEFEKTQYIHTACYGVKSADFYYFEDELEDKGFLKKVRFADSQISCISEKDAYREIVSKIKGNINYFLEKPFTAADLVHKYAKGLDGSRITHC